MPLYKLNTFVTSIHGFSDYIQEKWYFVTKIILTYCEKICSSDQEKLLKFEVEGRESAKVLRSLELFIYSERVVHFFNRMLL